MRIFVTVGNAREPFDRMVRLVDAALAEADLEVEGLFQLGHCTIEPKRLAWTRFVGRSEFDEEIRRADAVICHGGVGAVAAALDLGHTPIVVPRRASLSEHVNDHQLELATMLGESRRGLVVDSAVQMGELLAGFQTGRVARRESGRPRSAETEAIHEAMLSAVGNRRQTWLGRTILRWLAGMAPPPVLLSPKIGRSNESDSQESKG